MSKYGVFLVQLRKKYGPEKRPYLDTHLPLYEIPNVIEKCLMSNHLRGCKQSILSSSNTLLLVDIKSQLIITVSLYHVNIIYNKCKLCKLSEC